MSEFVKYPQSPIAADGWPILAFGIFAAVVFWSLYAFFSEGYPGLRLACGILGALAVIFVGFSIWFFRDPVRTPVDQSSNVVISAADGTVLKVEQVTDSRYGDGPAQKISIFMSPFNVHVNRAPIAGVIEKAEYIPGKFFVASLDKASTDNERNFILMRNERGQRVAFMQIAGLVARRIVCRVQAGDKLRAGQRYGMIRFGSRMEMFLPLGSTVSVKKGDRVMAGHTVVGRLP